MTSIYFHDITYAAVAIAIALMTNAIASPAYCNTAGPATTTVSAKSSVAAATSLLLIVVLNLLWIRLPNGIILTIPHY
jgi:hypothetical protein